MMQSQVFDALGLGAALLKAETALGLKSGAWAPAADPQKAEMQRKILARLPEIAAAIPALADLVRTWASASAEELNGILKAEGFDIELDPWPPGPRLFGVVAIVEVLVHWLVEGENAVVTRCGQPYPAFRLRCDSRAITFHAVASTRQPVVVLDTRSDDRVFLHKMDSVAGDFGLYDVVARLRRDMREDHGAGYSAVVIPKVKLRETVDLSWILGLAAGGWVIEQAKQQIRFAMNEIGAHAKTATALAVRSLPAAGPYTFDAPFLLWIERPGVAMPTFVAHLTEADWRDPGSLDAL